MDREAFEKTPDLEMSLQGAPYLVFVVTVHGPRLLLFLKRAGGGIWGRVPIGGMGGTWHLSLLWCHRSFCWPWWIRDWMHKENPVITQQEASLHYSGNLHPTHYISLRIIKSRCCDSNLVSSVNNKRKIHPKREQTKITIYNTLLWLTSSSLEKPREEEYLEVIVFKRAIQWIQCSALLFCNHLIVTAITLVWKAVIEDNLSNYYFIVVNG